MWRSAQRIGDRYRLVEKLGTGGMSVVWRGYDEILGRAVAVKVLTPQLARDHTFRDRLRQEALAAARLCHPHITGIFDFGESPLSERLTVPYVVMELNEGESVAARVNRDGPLPWRDAVTMVAEVASALATAHARGVVHRDVTPANVMLTSAGAKVVDFGISALVGQRDAAPDGSLLGTPAYLAPERLGGRPVSPATDVYALGLLLYRTLTGRLPWPAENTTEALRAHLYADPEPVPALPGMPAGVADLCLSCLAKDPGDRPAAADVAHRLAAVVGLPAIIADAPVRAPASLLPAHRPPGGRLASWFPADRAAGRDLASHRAAGVLRRLSASVPGRAMRLRLGLRVAAALRLGGVQPLGGGLFVGGRVPRDLLTGGRAGEALVAGRHRVQAVALTGTLLAVVGATWVSNREPAEVGPAQAAAAGTGAASGVLHRAACKVRYQVERDTGSDFEARLTLVNTGGQAVEDWRMEFAYPGTQRLTRPADAVTQKGRRIVVRGSGDLAAGRSVTMTLRGAYRSRNPLPIAFRLDGHPCEAEILGAATVPVAETQADRRRPPKAKPRRGTTSVRKSPASPPPAPAAPTVRPTPAPSRPPTAPPARPLEKPSELEPRRAGGFSVAV